MYLLRDNAVTFDWRTAVLVEIIKGFAPEHPVHVFVPPTQKTYALASKCDNIVWLEHYKARFVQSSLPEEVILPNGHKLTRPENWK